MAPAEPLRASEVDSSVSLFDRFSGRVSLLISRGPFFAGCCVFVLMWLMQGIVMMLASGPGAFTSTVYQLEINTTTTIVTFLMVAILQNASTRDSAAVQKKLNAMADGLADLIEWQAGHASSQEDGNHLRQDADELRAAVGLEHREGT